MPNGTDSMPAGLTAGPTPQWAIDRFGSEQAVYDYYGGLHEGARDAVWLADAQGAENLAATTAGWETGLGTLGGRIESIAGDPNFEAMMASLTEMMDPGYDAIGEVALAGIQGDLASGVNRAQSDRAGALRRAGLSGSGMDIGNAPLFTAIGSAGLADVSAQVEIANEEARRAATTQAGQMSLQQQGLLAPLDLAFAGMQADVPTSGYDPFVGASLDLALGQRDIESQRYEDEQARLDQAMSAWEASQPFAWAPDWLQGGLTAGQDILNLIMPFGGTGAARQLPGVLTGGSSGLAGFLG